MCPQPARQSRRTLPRLAVSLIFALTAASNVATAQQPDCMLKIIVPYVAGSGPDTLARLIGDELQQRRSQTVIVENRPGASGNLGTAAAANAKADGSTILLTASPFTQNVAFFKAVPYDPVKDFVPIVKFAEGYVALAVNPSVPAASATEFVDYVRARPSEVRYSSPGQGTPQHLSMELFKLATGTDITHVPYTGMPAAIRDVVGGHVSTTFVPIHIALPLAQAHKIRLLGVASQQRMDVAPDVPTLVEQGIKGVDLDFWFGVLAPAGTPPAFVERTNADINAIIQLPRIRTQMTAQGLRPIGGSVGEFADFIPRDLAKWRKIVVTSKLGTE